eukprot:674807-Pyramimonas_sp.AAC.1
MHTRSPFAVLPAWTRKLIEHSTVVWRNSESLLNALTLAPGCHVAAHTRRVLTVPLPENGECDLTLPGEFHSDGYEPTSAARFDQYMDFCNHAKTSGSK